MFAGRVLPEGGRGVTRRDFPTAAPLPGKAGARDLREEETGAVSSQGTGASVLDDLHGRGHIADIDRHFGRFAAELDGRGGREAALAGALASAWARAGHVCLTLSEVAGRDWPPGAGAKPAAGAVRLPALDPWAETLAASPVVARPGAEERRPLVLDFRGRLYLDRFWRAEQAVAAKLLRLAGAADREPRAAAELRQAADGTAEPAGKSRPPSSADSISATAPHRPPPDRLDPAAASPSESPNPGGPPPRSRDALAAEAAGKSGPKPGEIEAALDRFFPDAPANDPQRAAVRTALRQRLCVVSGGPGTGKTTIVAAIVALLIELGLAAPDRIALAAPTGKAAARLQEAVRARLASPAPPALRDALEGYGAEAMTLHRLLLRGGADGLPVDALILDEGSMVDLSLMARVLAALPEGARLIVLGDASQLASVEPGAVFADLCRAGGASSPLAPCVVELTRNWRFDETGGIGRLAAAAVRGDPDAVLAALDDPDDDATGLLPLPDGAAFRRLAAELADERFAPMLRQVREMRAPSAGLRPLQGFRVLCAHRTGPFGSERFNDAVEQRLRILGLARENEIFYPGRPILVTRNDPRTRLSNGDAGVVLRNEAGRTAVWFPELHDAAGGPRLVSPARLPPHESFFAITVHRAQGSEYDEAAVVPGPADSRAAARELLYTAVTRARERVRIYGARESITAAVERAAERSSGLHDALVKPPFPAGGPVRGILQGKISGLRGTFAKR